MDRADAHGSNHDPSARGHVRGRDHDRMPVAMSMTMTAVAMSVAVTVTMPLPGNRCGREHHRGGDGNDKANFSKFPPYEII